ncbi:MAG: hypothetical protein WC655_11060 [Candidatus Hydrogenedentales bacterium]
MAKILRLRGIKQGHMADKLGIRRGTFSAFMTNRSRSMRKDCMERLERAVHILENQDRIVSFQDSQQGISTLALPDFSRTFHADLHGKAARRRQAEAPGLDSIREELTKVLANGDPSFEASLRMISPLDLLRFYATYLAVVSEGNALKDGGK